MTGEALSATILQRLRAARLRPTIPRIAILHMVETAGLQALSAEDVFRQTMARGTQVGIGTVYRVLQQLEERGLLLREWDARRKTLYRLKPDDAQEQPLVMVCHRSGRRLRVVDPVLHERLQAAAHKLGLSLAGRQVRIEVDEMEGASGHESEVGPAVSAGRCEALHPVRRRAVLTPEPA